MYETVVFCRRDARQAKCNGYLGSIAFGKSTIGLTCELDTHAASAHKLVCDECLKSPPKVVSDGRTKSPGATSKLIGDEETPC